METTRYRTYTEGKYEGTIVKSIKDKVYFKRKVCPKCNFDCDDVEFCFYMQNVLEDDFTSLFDHINRNFLKISSDTVSKATHIICQGCSLKQECFVERYEYYCVKRIRKQFESECWIDYNYIESTNFDTIYDNCCVIPSSNKHKRSSFEPRKFVSCGKLHSLLKDK